MKKLLLFVLLFITVTYVKAQETDVWEPVTNKGNIKTDKGVARVSFPAVYKLFSVDMEALSSNLYSITGNRSASHSTIISLPNADGQIEQFEVFEASNFEPALQEQFPLIRAFSGKGLTDKYASLKLSISPQGVQTMVFRTDRENEFMEPYSADHRIYAVFKSQRKSGMLPWTCSTVDRDLATGINNLVLNTGITARSGGDLKTMRLAQSCNAEYSNYFGATSASQVSLVLAAFNATLTRCNGIYEKDLALHLNLIANTTSVIYYNASTDPYSTTLSQWNSQLQSTLTSVIGEANYDIGHMFGASGGGGNAGCIGCVCVNGSKGSGITSPNDGIPQGDNFDIDYVAHEVGHQLGANHTFSMSNESTGVNKEPGSGITIMGYAGITSQDLAPHSIDVFHQASIAQIQANLATKTCPVTTVISANNATPVVAAVSNYTIPKSTPFALTGSASDANAGDVLTYSWEQNDNASTSQTGASSVASATKASGPNWISFSPSSSPTRYFPKLSTILAGALISGPLTGGDAGANTEALSSVARTLNFRLTVRDNCPYSSTVPVKVGQTQFTDMVVTVSSASGPFAVTAPNTAVTWAGGSTQTITWSVASTTAAPVSCANVKISLSTDGGLTFPTVLAASTANDGSEALVIPATPTTTARIKIESVGNIFFDISNSNFTIGASVTCGDASGLSATGITTSGANLSWAAVTNAISYSVDYKLNTSATWINLSAAQTTTSASLSGLNSGSLYDWRIRATCSAGSGNYVTSQFTTLVPCVAPTGLSSSVTSNSATLSWSAVAAATSYAVEYKLNSSSTWTSFSTAQTTTNANLTGLAASSLYDWRVSATCPSGTTTATTAQFTTSAPAVCNAATGLTTSSITSGSATVSWSAVSGAASYAVDYKLNSSSTWISFSTAQTGTTANLTGLSASSLYDWRVITNCSSGSSTAATAQFTTTAASTCATAFEPNETQAAAVAITSGVTNSAAISSSTDIDYYKITTTATSNIVYNLVGPSGVDFDLTIYNSAGTQIGSGSGSTATETVSLTNQAAGTYFIKVFGYNGANSTTCYTIKATATTATGCQSSYDVSTNGTTAGAATIPFNTNVTGLISPSADVDNYKFVITNAGTITLTLTTLPADFDLKLLNSAGTQVGISQKGGTSSESISYTAAAGTYYAQVYGYNGANNASSCYTLKVQLGTASKEANPDFAGKNAITAYPNPVKEILYVDIPASVSKQATLQVMDTKGTIVLSQIVTRNTQPVDVSRLAAGVYMIRVMHAGTVTTTKFVKD